MLPGCKVPNFHFLIHIYIGTSILISPFPRDYHTYGRRHSHFSIQLIHHPESQNLHCSEDMSWMCCMSDSEPPPDQIVHLLFPHCNPNINAQWSQKTLLGYGIDNSKLTSQVFVYTSIDSTNWPPPSGNGLRHLLRSSMGWQIMFSGQFGKYTFMLQPSHGIWDYDMNNNFT